MKDTLRHIHERKTGALICASVRTGAMLAHATPAELEALSRYGEHLGLAFQIVDDILDVTGEAASLGKTTGADAARSKATYPAVMGLERAQQCAEEASQAAAAALDGFGERGGTFRALARYVVARQS